MRNSDILRRLDLLEAKFNPPTPQEIRVMFADSENYNADKAAFIQEHPSGKIVTIVTVCCRKCPEDTADCPGSGRKSCRFNCEGITDPRHRGVTEL